MKALVIGGARSGIGVAHLLNQKGFTVVLATNQDFEERGDLEAKGIIVSLNDRDLSLVDDYDVVVKNPGIPGSHPLVSQFKHVVNEIEVAARFAPHYDFYAISGTNGKTTTVSLLYDMLSRKDTNALLAGNVGYALSEAVYRDGDFKRDVALEIAAFQMEGTPTFSPKVYGLLNLTPDHLDRFENEAAYYQAKLNILDNVGIFVRNVDDKTIVAKTTTLKPRCIDISMQRMDTDVFIKAGWVVFHDTKLFAIKDLKLVGSHNVMNAMFAATMASLAGVDTASIQASIAAFKGVHHRIEFVREYRGVRYYNDSKATNPESCEVALQAFDRPIHLLAGGYDKHISFDILKKYESKIASLHVFGDSAQQIKSVFPQAVVVETMAQALSAASEMAQENDVVLLSPACASYDQFDNYEQRGDIFKTLVHQLNQA